MPAALTAHAHTLPPPRAHHKAHPDDPLNARLKALHQRASRALILGQGAVAWAHCCDAVQHCTIAQLASDYGEHQARQLCCRMWILYICVLSSLAEPAAQDGSLQPKHNAALTAFPASVRIVWARIVQAFGGRPGCVDSEVLVPAVLLCLKLRDAPAAREFVEAWLATLPLDAQALLLAPGSERAMPLASYMRVCELYTLHVLPQLGDFAAAHAFLAASAIVPAAAKDEYARRLDSLRAPPRRRQKTRPPKPAKAARPPDAAGRKKTDPSSDAVGRRTCVSAAPIRPAPTRPAPTRPALMPTKPAATRAPLARRPPQSAAAAAWRVVRRLMSRWGLTVLTLAVVAAVLRLVAQRFRLPPLLNAVARRL
ncbi:hypothetical protein LPJ66_011510, partial [Kickxella alabastrina]